MHQKPPSLFLYMTLFIAFAFLSACVDEGKTQLAAVEIKDYKGKDLSSINDFRENSIKGPQRVDKDAFRLAVDGLVQTPREFDYRALTTGLPAYEKMVTLNCVEGWSVDILWEGFLLKDLLAGAKPKPEGQYVIFHAADGYTTMLPLAWLLEKDVIVAYKMNGVELPAERGFPLQLVAEDKLGYKWIKWITRIELSDKADYRGYWESRGYEQEADIGK